MRSVAILGILLSFFLIIGPIFAIAQNIGVVKGRVVDNLTNEGLPGANVVLTGTKFGAATDRFGNFRIERVPLGAYTIRVSYIGYEEFTTDINLTQVNPVVDLGVIRLKISAVKTEEVVVYGLMQGQVRAFNQELTSVDIRNVLSREEIEKFPDLNTADALQRIPGVYTQRSLGEGTYVYVRGTEPRLTYVTIDGLKLASSADNERSVDVGVINSKQLAFVEVVKALTPDMDADGIGGVVNLVTKSSFDQPGISFKFEAGGGYAALSKKPIYRFAVLHSEPLSDKFGFTAAINYYRNYIHSHSNEFEWGDVKDVNGNTIPFALKDFRLFYYSTIRDHYGVSGTFSYKPNEEHMFNLRLMYNRRDDDQSRNMVRYRLDRGRYLNATTITDGRMAFEFQNRNEVHSNYIVTFGGVSKFGEFKVDYNLHYSFANQRKENPGQIKSEWVLNTRVNWLLDLSNVDFPKFTVTNMDESYVRDPANWTIDRQDYRTTNIKNNIYVGLFNVNYRYNLFGFPSDLKFGAKVRMDVKKRTASRSAYVWRGGQSVLMSSVSNFEQVSNFLKGNYIFAPTIDNSLVRDFFNRYRGLPSGLVESVIYNDPDGMGGDYDNREDIYMFYIMNTFYIGNLTVLVGVRDEYTRTNYKGFQVFLDARGNFLSMGSVSKRTKYNSIFPNIHLRYNLGERTVVRVAFTRTISRPDFFDLAPYYWLDPKNTTIIKGNPDLMPTMAFNADLMIAHYFRGIGVLSAGLFYKDMDKVIYPRIYQQVGGPYDGYKITEPVNGGKAKLYGFEVNWNQYFTFLPGFLGGFGVFANYTYTKSKAQLQYREWSVMPGQAADVGNLGLSYDKYNLTARLTLNYTSPLLYQVGPNPDFDRYNDKRLRLDFTAIYKISTHFSIYLDWINITNNPDREYFGVSSRPRLNAYYGWQLYVGLKFE